MNDETITLDGTDTPDAAHVTVDEPADAVVGTVLLVPPFGMSASSLFAAAYVLAVNGLRVFRLEPRNAPDGGSSNLRGFRLSRLHDDIATALRVLQPDGLLAVSLSARPALRAIAAEGCRVGAAAFITPVVDVSHTLKHVMGEDVFERASWDTRTQYLNVLGHDVDMDFARDCARAGFTDHDGTRQDISAVRSRVMLVAGSADPWVDVRQLRDLARDGAPDVELVEVPAASHQLYRNPVLAMRFFAVATDHLLRLIAGTPQAAVVPSFGEIVAELESTRRTA